jgi:hypothetical protein
MCKALDLDNAGNAGNAVIAGNVGIARLRPVVINSGRLRRTGQEATSGSGRERQTRESFPEACLELTAIEGVGSAPDFVFGCFFSEILAFVRVSFAFSDTDLDFYSMVLPVQPESDEA